MLCEAVNALSKTDFIHIMHCAKECDESMYWLELLKVRDYLPEDEFKSIHEQSNDVLKIIRSIIITLRETHKS
jgi:four helix bundle protein